ncbi:hypothetical protein [Caulobacter sp. 1776]
MAKTVPASTVEVHWWQRNPLTAAVIGWTVIIGGVAVSLDLFRFALRNL